MKNVVIFGAAGHTGKYITRRMMQRADISLSVFVRNPAKFGEMALTGVNVITGDALNVADVMRAMDGQDVMLCSLEGTQPKGWKVDRAAIAQCMADLIADETMGVNKCLGITNK